MTSQRTPRQAKAEPVRQAPSGPKQRREELPDHGKRMVGVSLEGMAEAEVFEYIRLGILGSRASSACMSPRAQAEFSRRHGDGYEGSVARELAILPTVEELHAKYSPNVLASIAEETEARREEQAQKLVAGFGDKGRKDFQESLWVEILITMSRLRSPRTGKARSKKELVRDFSRLSGLNERTVRRLWDKSPEPYTVRFSFETNQRKAKYPVN